MSHSASTNIDGSAHNLVRRAPGAAKPLRYDKMSVASLSRSVTVAAAV